MLSSFKWVGCVFVRRFIMGLQLRVWGILPGVVTVARRACVRGWSGLVLCACAHSVYVASAIVARDVHVLR